MLRVSVYAYFKKNITNTNEQLYKGHFLDMKFICRASQIRTSQTNKPFWRMVFLSALISGSEVPQFSCSNTKSLAQLVRAPS